ncbi:MAG: O-sialoglycoprotein endopeptidase [Firmicutes bacterium]|nr:O-sialoglycoprotein endopeptidase [Bacillota bacterium]
MHKNRDLVLGIDTSNYKTSVAVIGSEGKILCDLRKLLKVKQGERGLRQSDALFQHIENMPYLLERALAGGQASRIAAVAYSQRPRPVEGSYMPVFKAGISFGQAVATALQVPSFGFSHQEGHIEAIRAGSELPANRPFLCYHLSGGTCELLLVNQDQIQIIGGSKDISFGQVIDRAGVKLGMAFPAGEEMDRIAMKTQDSSQALKKIPYDGLFFNLSGLETQWSRTAENRIKAGEETDSLIRELFDKILKALIQITEQAAKETSINSIMFTGGVSSSRYISGKLKTHFENSPLFIEFGDQSLSQDNAVGIALLGGRKLWR